MGAGGEGGRGVAMEGEGEGEGQWGLGGGGAVSGWGGAGGSRESSPEPLPGVSGDGGGGEAPDRAAGGPSSELGRLVAAAERSDVGGGGELSFGDVEELIRAEEAARPGVPLGDAEALCHLLAIRTSKGEALEGPLEEATHLRLDRERIESLSGDLVAQLPAVTHLYLQNNRLRRADALLGFGSLRFLTLAHNMLEHVEGFNALNHLRFLDVSHNHLVSCAPGDLPVSLRFLRLEGNPCVQTPKMATSMRISLVADLEDLEEIDGCPFSRKELLAAGYDPDSDWEEEQAPGTSSSRAGPGGLGGSQGAGHHAAVMPPGPGPEEDEEPVSELERQITQDIDREVQLERNRLMVEHDGTLQRQVNLLKEALPKLRTRSFGASPVEACGAIGAFESMVGGDRGAIQEIRQRSLERARVRSETFRLVQEATDADIRVFKQKIGTLVQAGKSTGGATRPSSAGGRPAARPSTSGGGRGPGGGAARPPTRPGTAPARRPGSAAPTRPAPLEI